MGKSVTSSFPRSHVTQCKYLRTAGSRHIYSTFSCDTTATNTRARAHTSVGMYQYICTFVKRLSFFYTNESGVGTFSRTVGGTVLVAFLHFVCRQFKTDRLYRQFACRRPFHYYLDVRMKISYLIPRYSNSSC